MSSKTVVFVHGMFVTPDCWRDWVPYFEQRGYRAIAPAWPEHEPPASAQRARHPNPALAKLTIGDLLEHHRGIIKGLGEKPVLVGHSLGGLLVQLLLQEDLAVAGVAIDSAPPNGVISLSWSFLKSNIESLDPFTSLDKPYLMDEEAFRYRFANTLPLEEQHAAWEAHVVPESRRVWKGPTSAAAKIDFKRARPPLLLIAGEKDHILPAGLNRKNFERYTSASVTEFKEFPGRDHFLIGATRWQEIADFALSWIGQRAQ